MSGTGRTMTFGADPGGPSILSWKPEGKKYADGSKPVSALNILLKVFC